MVRLSRVHPTFAGGPRAVLSTRLVRAMRSGDLALARELARVRSDVGIGAHGEVLAELALADAADDRDDRISALRDELSAMPSLDRWARTVAPSLLGRTAPEP